MTKYQNIKKVKSSMLFKWTLYISTHDMESSVMNSNEKINSIENSYCNVSCKNVAPGNSLS